MPILEVNLKMSGKREVCIDKKFNGLREKELHQKLMGRNSGSGVGDQVLQGSRSIVIRKMEVRKKGSQNQKRIQKCWHRKFIR